MLEIKDSVAVITGGAGGIGTVLARYWLKNGGKVVIGDISQALLDKCKTEMNCPNGNVTTVLCDVTNEDDCGRLADTAIEQYGKINLLAPFAGITKDGFMVSRDKETGKVKKKMALDQFQSVIDINLTGVFLTLREGVERMINNNCKGLICLVSSTGSLGTAGQINYSSSKAAMSVIPKVLTAAFFRQGLSDKLRCVAIAPGYTGTPLVRGMKREVIDRILEQVPIGRLVEPEEVVSLVSELYRNEACAGEVFFIHGGLRLGSRG
ncbi:MAG: SDR family NAD(P)-dependent oxidoreductase [Deltaproteobacteria bacterium]|nr:SDR family NAD(P)-dependent oxidoreductase [Deltaproteobacteria bacterium]